MIAKCKLGFVGGFCHESIFLLFFGFVNKKGWTYYNVV
ncbi:putative membrane protein [Acinetobacter baumannii 1437282]|nr:putative membrane protein [Acinetobacter baumannii 1437282]